MHRASAGHTACGCRMLGTFVFATCGTLGIIYVDTPFAGSKFAQVRSDPLSRTHSVAACRTHVYGVVVWCSKGMPGYSVYAFLTIIAGLVLVGIFIVLATVRCTLRAGCALECCVFMTGYVYIGISRYVHA